MKTLLTALIITLSGASIFAHTLTFGTGSDDKGTLTGQNTSFSIKQSESITCLISNSESFGTPRYVLKTYAIDENGSESLDDTVTVDVHENWSWSTLMMVYNDKNSGDYKQRIVLYDMKGKQLCEAVLKVNIKSEGAVFIDQDKLNAYSGIWDAMMFSSAKAEVAVIGGGAKKGGKAGSASSISLAGGKEIQVTVYTSGTYAFPAGKVTFDYTQSANTSGKADVTSSASVPAGKGHVVHNVKLSEGEWKLSVKDASGTEIVTQTFTVTK